MATARNTKSAASPFGDLLSLATTEPKKIDSSRSRDRYNIEVPAEYVDFVKRMHTENQRAVFPVTEKDEFDKMAALFRAAGDKAELSVTVKARYDGEGDDAKLTHLTFTVGARRGAKDKKGASDAPSDK